MDSGKNILNYLEDRPKTFLILICSYNLQYDVPYIQYDNIIRCTLYSIFTSTKAPVEISLPEDFWQVPVYS